ncbi:MAG: hypothetical protein HY907_07190 [Deltaproteobacteria bacterium]|nr:hypothetical protein [Deltaproteobacteria bacterium]
MRRPLFALALLLGCGTSAAVEATPPEGPDPAATPCNAIEDSGRLAAGRTIEVLRRELRVGDLLQAALDCTPPDAVQLELEGPSVAGADDATGGGAGGDRHVWTEFPRPLPPGVDVCPRDGCPAEGSAWLPPALERRIATAGEYVLRLRATDRAANCSVCVRIEPVP